ncbi:MAG: CHAT domain-containing protein [Synechococcales bacterium]|nr:CHAT domain-containing protein [Synechococcales bacterium]
MAGKWRLLFHRLFAVLSSGQRFWKPYRLMSRRLRRAVYVLLGCIALLGCWLATPGAARLPSPRISSPLTAAIAQTPPTPISNTPSAEQLEQTARERYAAGQFQDAAIAFQQAAQQYQAQGDLVQQALSLSNLSLSQQQLGAWSEAEQAISESLALLETELQQQNTSARQSAYAQALNIRARLDLARGRGAQAIAIWEKSAAIHSQLGQTDQAMASQISQARALQRLGLYSRAITLLQTALEKPGQLPLSPASLKDIPDETTASELDQWLRSVTTAANANTVAALQTLGDSLQIVGNLKQAETILQHSLALAQTLELSEAIASIHLSLGNVVRASAIADLQLKNMSVKQAVDQLQKPLSPIQQELQYRQTQAAKQFEAQTTEALADYQQAAMGSSPPTIQVQAHLNRLNLLLDIQQTTEAEATLAQVTPLLNRLPPTRAAIDARINLAQRLRQMAKTATSQPAAKRLQAAQLLATAQQDAIALGDPHAESYALGSLGQLYEESQQWSEAAALTQQALDKVNAVSATNVPHTVTDADLAYRWYYQLGRIRAAQGDRQGASAAYQVAADILQNRLSLDVVSSNLSYQFAFDQEAQEPVHQEWMALLLKSANPSQADLKQVREISTSLLNTQLNSFLQEPCTVASPDTVDAIVEASDPQTALFYPVILPDRLDVIVKFPGTADLHHHYSDLSGEQLSEILNRLQIALEEDYTFEAVQELSEQLYNWLIQPVASRLEAEGIKTLVFTLDRRLQSIPMAVLYDGQRYLIEKYAVSQVLGLQFDRSERSLQPGELKIIGAGLSTAPTAKNVGGEDITGLFLPLNYVREEMKVLRELAIPSTTLEDEEFTLANFNLKLNEQKFPIVHLATHGQFSFDPKRTFVMTADPTPVDVDQLAGLFRVRGQVRLDAIELLVVNACETAAGDDLATLGIAGAAVRAGARSAIASLWTLDDAPNVSFTQTLYDYLRQPSVSRAEAVRQAQRALLQNPQYRHPRYWAPYILAGNWLPLTTSRSAGSADSSTSN